MSCMRAHYATRCRRRARRAHRELEQRALRRAAGPSREFDAGTEGVEIIGVEDVRSTANSSGSRPALIATPPSGERERAEFRSRGVSADSGGLKSLALREMNID